MQINISIVVVLYFSKILKLFSCNIKKPFPKLPVLFPGSSRDVHGLKDCIYSLLHCSHSRQFFFRPAGMLLSSFFSLKYAVNKEKGLYFIIHFFNDKLGFVCVTVSVEDVRCLGGIVCWFLILITLLCVFMNMNFESWVLNICESCRGFFFFWIFSYAFLISFLLIIFWQELLHRCCSGKL